MTTNSILEPLPNPNSPIYYNLIGNDFKDEPVMLEDNACRRSREIKFILEHIVYFCVTLKELVIVKTFKLEHIKIYSGRATTICQSEKYT